MICDDEKDILLAFSIELQTKYNVLTAESGEQYIKKHLDAKHSGRKIAFWIID
jgi:response regulator RpfG family c-di-GMP phosphodiesterase